MSTKVTLWYGPANAAVISGSWIIPTFHNDDQRFTINVNNYQRLFVLPPDWLTLLCYTLKALAWIHLKSLYWTTDRVPAKVKNTIFYKPTHHILIIDTVNTPTTPVARIFIYFLFFQEYLFDILLGHQWFWYIPNLKYDPVQFEFRLHATEFNIVFMLYLYLTFYLFL